MDDDPPHAVSIDQAALEPVVRDGLVIVGIAVLTALALAVPGSDRMVPGTALEIDELIVAGGVAAVVGSLLHAAPHVRDLVASSLDGAPTVVEDAGAIAGYLVAFVAVVIAHRGLGTVAAPMLQGGIWVYDLAFLAFAAVPLALIARRMYGSLDPIAALVSRQLVGSSDSGSSNVDA